MDVFDFRSPAGGAKDLNLRLDSPLSPRAVTQVLQTYGLEKNGKPVNTEGLAELTVGKRIELLLRIVSESGGGNLLLSMRCHACDETMELELAFHELVEMQQEAEKVATLTIEIDGRDVQLRRPTAADQLLWQSLSCSDPRDTYLVMLNTLMVTGGDEIEHLEVCDATLKELSEALKSYDPLVYFEMEIGCPYCQTSSTYTLDLLEVAATQLQRNQMQLMQTVHRLAQRYHWSETEILTMPDWRRKRYLRLIDQESGE